MTEPSPGELTIAAYDATAAVYAAAIGTEISDAIEAPLDHAMLRAFDELVAADGLVADIGCGPGRVAAWMAGRGRQVIGIDPSAGMLAVAATAHPGLEFRLGDLTDLPLHDASLAGAVCWYSIIHTQPDELAAAFAELARVLAPGAPLLIAFQAGRGEVVHRSTVQDIPVSMTNHRHDPELVIEQLEAAAFHVRTRARRVEAGAHESTPQAFLIAVRGPA